MRPSPEVRAVCHRCGGPKLGPFVPCKACGVVPMRDARAIAWLLSAHHLDDSELDEVARRIQSGDVPDPPRALRDEARRAMGAVGAPPEDDRPLAPGELVAVGLATLFLTPLLGLAMWLGLREARPRAARQSMAVTVPMSGILVLIWAADRLSWWSA